jgi:GMP synthase-like glutamine amidotransferase
LNPFPDLAKMPGEVRTMPIVACIQHVACEGPGLLEDVLRQQGCRLKTFHIHAGQAPPSEPEDGLIVLGGPMSAYDPPSLFPSLKAEVSLVRKCLDRGIPVLGICLGSQILASACGARVYKGGKGPEIGWYPIRTSASAGQDPLLAGMPAETTVFHWHGDTFDLPAGAVLLASSDLYPHQVFRTGSGWGFQCHLEVTEAMVREWLEVYRPELIPHGGKVDDGPIRERLEENARDLEPLARTVFSRFAERVNRP